MRQREEREAASGEGVGEGVAMSEVLRAIWRHEFDLAARDGVADYGEVWSRIAVTYEEARSRGGVELEDGWKDRQRAWARGRR